MSSVTRAVSDETQLKESTSTQHKPNGQPPVGAKSNGASPDPAEPPSGSDDKKPGFVKRAISKLGLDAVTLILMTKGALPGTIALAAYQADSFAQQYTTLGYLIAIMATLSLALLPRAKFLQSMFLSLVFVCLGAAIALLQIQTCVSARHRNNVPPASQTGSSGSQQAVAYSAAASATAAVWLFATVYFANALRSLRPQMNLPVIQYSIFTLVASSYAASFPNMDAGMNFVRRLLLTYLTGFGIATGVNLFVFPLTSRLVAAKQLAGLLGLLTGALKSHGSFMQNVTEAHQQMRDGSGAEIDTSEVQKMAKELKSNLTKVGELFSKVKIEVGFAKKELGYGKLGPQEFSDILVRLSEIILPVIGMSTFLDIMASVKDRKEKRNKLIDTPGTLEAVRLLESEEWIEAMAISREPYIKAKEAFIQGLTHIGLVLKLMPRPKSPKGDIEKDANAAPKPGDPGFVELLEESVRAYHQHRNSTIRAWCEKKGIDLPPSFWEDPNAQYLWKDTKSMTDSVRQTQNQQQLYLVLYMEYLMLSIGRAILRGVRYADSKVEDGTLKRARFINPGLKRIKKLFSELFTSKDHDEMLTDGNNTGTSIWVGDSLGTRKDPEHLPPKNAYERITHHLRGISTFLASEASAFGFRAAVATISLGLLAYIRQSHTFFLEQRGLWALIMTAISMDSNTGRGLFSFAGRIAGTVVACAASIGIWYIGYKQPGAIIPVFFIYLCIGFWGVIKYPSVVIVVIISVVTAILIVGYELQEVKIGRAITESNGQPFYEIYILAPFRLATVCAGIAVAFFWSYFPYPVTTHGTLRKDLGHTLYLLANYYSCVHTTVTMRLKHGADISLEDEKAIFRVDRQQPHADKKKGKNVPPMIKLAKARLKCFSKLMMLLSKLREHSNFTKWEPTFGGRFPRETYDELIDSLQHMFNYISLLSYSSAAFVTADGDDSQHESEWLRDFRTFAGDIALTSHELTSVLCLLSASVTNSQPLPPYLGPMRSFDLASRMDALDPGILSVQHINEPCYAAFAVLEVASSLIVEEVKSCVARVTELVGEVDFSFHVVSTTIDMGADGESTKSVATTLLGDGNGSGEKDGERDREILKGKKE